MFFLEKPSSVSLKYTFAYKKSNFSDILAFESDQDNYKFVFFMLLYTLPAVMLTTRVNLQVMWSPLNKSLINTLKILAGF